MKIIHVENQHKKNICQNMSIEKNCQNEKNSTFNFLAFQILSILSTCYYSINYNSTISFKKKKIQSPINFEVINKIENGVEWAYSMEWNGHILFKLIFTYFTTK
ncbi:unnamed protein product [Meganyctiphanes norvegica]|uniref:Uncharacterized protein n=1 Tax=Meganyctiphanes norvegica TaxID=48144 RepID=A0AAV2Q9K1_MEGNR